ncbi:MAG: hypothetical protein CSA75_03670 [Sorangium cellulosum]|nr:MAG: hypothetical protein CSA75_03670 [Sorangium cellulosum]
MTFSKHQQLPNRLTKQSPVVSADGKWHTCVENATVSENAQSRANVMKPFIRLRFCLKHAIKNGSDHSPTLLRSAVPQKNENKIIPQISVPFFH